MGHLINSNVLVAACACLSVSACAHGGKPETSSELHGMGMIVVDDLAPGASPKEGVVAISDAGNELFAHAKLIPHVFANSSFGPGTNMSFPRWVHVTWRTGPGIVLNFGHAGFIGGTVTGDYTIEVLSRIPAEVFNYAAAGRGHAIVLRFRIKDDGVLLAWDVQELVKHPSGGRGLVYSLHGGDFPCETSPYQRYPDCTSGRLEDAPWYDPSWIRE